MKSFLVLVLSIFVTFQAAHAQSVNCGLPYAAIDRASLRPYLANDLRLMSMLSRIHALATLSSVASFTPPQRMALNSEYQALLTQITTVGDWRNPIFRPRTNAWLHRIVDADFMGLTGTDLLSAASASTALWATVTASDRFYNCY